MDISEYIKNIKIFETKNMVTNKYETRFRS
jgi:hypothetical protein